MWLSYHEDPKMLDCFEQSRGTTDYRNLKEWELGDQLGGSCRDPGRGPGPRTTVETEEVVRGSQGEKERRPKFPVSPRDEALFHCAKPSGVPRGPDRKSVV